MKAITRWMTAALAAVLTASLSIGPGLAAPPAEPFADFRIDAASMDVPDRDISVCLCQRDSGGAFQADGVQEYSCKLNRVTEDASFYIQPRTDGVWVTVDYLTDVNGDGVYELLDGGGAPVWDVMDEQGGLAQGEAVLLSSGQTYILSTRTLADRYQQAVQRNAGELGLEAPDRKGFPLCRITLRHTDPADGQSYEQLYYLELYGKILLPFDVSPDQWYYSAVEYGRARGWLTGLEDGRFGPDEPLNRAQLAQVLWTMDGCLEAEGSSFSDVEPDDWFARAVSWCQEKELISGYADGAFLPDAPLTREQLAAILYRYAQYSGSSLRTNASLSVYEDRDDVSSWAYNSVCWAMTNRLLTTSDHLLRPGETVTRAELASALYSYDINLGARSTW